MRTMPFHRLCKPLRNGLGSDEECVAVIDCNARQKPSSRFARVFVLVVIEVDGKHIETEKQALAFAAFSEKFKQFACGAVTALIHLFARLAMGHPERVLSRRQVA